MALGIERQLAADQRLFFLLAGRGGALLPSARRSTARTRSSSRRWEKGLRI